MRPVGVGEILVTIGEFLTPPSFFFSKLQPHSRVLPRAPIAPLYKSLALVRISMIALAARLQRSFPAALHLVGVGMTLGGSLVRATLPRLHGATAALHAGDRTAAAASRPVATLSTSAPWTGPCSSGVDARMPAGVAGAAAAMLGRRIDRVAGMLPRPSLGASSRFASTATGAAAPAAEGGKTHAPLVADVVAVKPSAVLFKVGDGGIWSSFEHEKLLSMDRSKLMEALAGSKMFALKFKDIDLSACSIAVIKNAALPAGADEPSAEHEAGDSVVEMKLTKTVGDMANDFGASGAPFFVRVGLPPTVHAGEQWGSGAVVHDSAWRGLHDFVSWLASPCARVHPSAGS